VVGKHFEENGLSHVNLTGPEDVNDLVRTMGYVKELTTDPKALKYFKIFAVHGYDNGGVSAAGGEWEKLGAVAKRFNLSLWMTETSGFSYTDFSGALTLSETVWHALYWGNLEGWIWWLLYYGGPASDDYKMGESIISQGNKTKRYYVHKQFARFVRAGAVRVSTTSDNTEVLTLAFVHPEEKMLSVVIINKGSGSTQVTLSGSGVPAAFDRYQTSASDNCAKSSLGSTTLSVPGQSITTLVASNFTSTVSVDRPRVQESAFQGVSRGAKQLFMLDGRSLPAAKQASGLRCGVVIQSVRGRPASLGIYGSR